MITNAQARFKYYLDAPLRCGIALQGWEVKSIRAGQARIVDGYVSISKSGELFLIGCHIAPLPGARNTSDPMRSRKLLAKKSEISAISKAVNEKGRTVVATKMYVNEQGRVKVEICTATGKNVADKRQTIKDREWGIEKARLAKGG